MRWRLIYPSSETQGKEAGAREKSIRRKKIGVEKSRMLFFPV